jgi:hypothetical protein
MKPACVFILLLGSLNLASCNLFSTEDKPKTEVDKLPPLTHTGENTFGCLVNGKAFVVTNTSDMAAIYQGGGLSISGGVDFTGQFKSIEVFVGETISNGAKFDLINNTNHQGQFYNDESGCFYFTNSEYKGFIEITFFDSNAFIVSGLFEFEAVSNECTDIIKVTEGRFDMQYTP